MSVLHQFSVLNIALDYVDEGRLESFQALFVRSDFSSRCWSLLLHILIALFAYTTFIHLLLVKLGG